MQENNDKKTKKEEGRFHYMSAFKNRKHFRWKIGSKNKLEENDESKNKRSSKIKNKTKCKLAENTKEQNYTSAKEIQPKPKPKRKWKKTLFKFAVILVLGFVSGSAIAAVYRRTLTPVSYPAEEEPFLDDTDKIIALATGKENPTEEDLKNFSTLAKNNGKTPLDFSPSQNYALANYKSSLATTFSTHGEGKVETLLGPQTVFSEKLYDGNKYFDSSISLGTLTIAKCAIFDKREPNVVTTIEGTNIKKDSAVWNGTQKKYTAKGFKDMTGGLPSTLLSYIISSKTILNEDQVEIIKTEYNGQEVYEFTINLHTINAVILYHKQVRYTSGLSSEPTFENIKLKIVIDSDWNFVRTEAEESYAVVYGIKTSCKGSLTVDYTFNQPVEIDI